MTNKKEEGVPKRYDYIFLSEVLPSKSEHFSYSTEVVADWIIATVPIDEVEVKENFHLTVATKSFKASFCKPVKTRRYSSNLVDLDFVLHYNENLYVSL